LDGTDYSAQLQARSAWTAEYWMIAPWFDVRKVTTDEKIVAGGSPDLRRGEADLGFPIVATSGNRWRLGPASHIFRCTDETGD